MKSFFGRSILIVSLVLILSTTLLAQQRQNETTTLTNTAVVKLVRAGFKEKTIISIISSRIPAFDLSPDRMIELKRSGVSEKIIVAMLARQEGMDPLDDESWADEMSMGSLELPKGSNSGNGSGNGSDPGTNIFGSSGGSRGETRSRGGNGSASGETVTTGSATVRILKPPTEAGGAGTTKLEKAKTLTNDSIVELVEAGFSEGTIIRRIEQSPVEFDLAATKLEELRKQRVSEKILAAMKVAMGDERIK
jgi:hypothetical protein